MIVCKASIEKCIIYAVFLSVYLSLFFIFIFYFCSAYTASIFHRSNSGVVNFEFIFDFGIWMFKTRLLYNIYFKLMLSFTFVDVPLDKCLLDFANNFLGIISQFEYLT